MDCVDARARVRGQSPERFIFKIPGGPRGGDSGGVSVRNRNTDDVAIGPVTSIIGLVCGSAASLLCK